MNETSEWNAWIGCAAANSVARKPLGKIFQKSNKKGELTNDRTLEQSRPCQKWLQVHSMATALATAASSVRSSVLARIHKSGYSQRIHTDKVDSE